MNGYVKAMSQYATFRGRASRSEFWQLTVVVWVVIIAAYFLIWPMLYPEPGPVSIWGHLSFVLIASSPHILPSAAVLVRRLHDMNWSGWWAFAAMFPPTALVLLIFALLPGTVGSNRFGDDPLSLERGGNELGNRGGPPLGR